MTEHTENHLLVVEPFYSGSHKQLVDLLHDKIPGSCLVTLPGKKWQWKARTSALYLSQTIPRDEHFRTLFASSVLNMCELVSLRPDLGRLHKVLYFHENQLIYPVRKQQNRDFQYGYNQITSCLVADVVLFNSKYNMESFLTSINTFLKILPDHRPKDLVNLIRPKCHVMYFPMDVSDLTAFKCEKDVPYTEKDNEAKNVLDIPKAVTDIQEDTTENVLESVSNDNASTSTNNIADESGKPVMNVDYRNVPGGDARQNNGHIPESVVIKDLTNANESESVKVIDESEFGTLCTSSDNDITNQSLTLSEERALIEEENINLVSTCKKAKLDETNTEISKSPLHIVWPHRWEHDKGPESFFHVMHQLHEAGCDFRLSVLGETFTDVPDVFEKSKGLLKDHIDNWGYLPSKTDYIQVLQSADCVVSTAKHEFFGVAMLEAVHMGCFPLCPNRLVYPEIFPKVCMYNTDQQLFKRLREFCRKPYLLRRKSFQYDVTKFSWEALGLQFKQHLNPNTDDGNT